MSADNFFLLFFKLPSMQRVKHHGETGRQNIKTLHPMPNKTCGLKSMEDIEVDLHMTYQNRQEHNSVNADQIAFAVFIITSIKTFVLLYQVATWTKMTDKHICMCSSYHNHLYYSKTCVKKDKILVFKPNYCLMQVKSIAECSKGSILQYF